MGLQRSTRHLRRAAIGLALVIAAAGVAPAQKGMARKVGVVDYFGYKGTDMGALRAAVPLHEGDPFDPAHFDEDLFRMVVERALGHKLTDVNKTCCDAGGNYLIYLGVGGASYHAVQFHQVPTGKVRLPAAVRHAADALDNAVGKAVLSGHAEEDDSQGFFLLKDPGARAKMLDFHKTVLREEKSVYDVLVNAADDEERANAAEALGYANRSDAQIQALVEASLDSSSSVRNNAIRALDVLLSGFPELAAKVPAQPFIELLSSGIWTDHNKASMLFERLTRLRDPKLLDELRAQALDSLEEMARWKAPGHAWAARMILGRMVRMNDEELAGDQTPEQVERIIAAVELGRKK